VALGIGLGPASGTRVGAQAAPQAPPVPGPSLNATVAPTTLPTALPSGVPVPTVTPTAAPRGRRRGRTPASPAPSAAPSAPEPTATPTSPAFATLDGTWEVQLQYIDHTDYSYFDLRQNGSGGLTGSWRIKGKPYPLAGTYDGRLIHLTVTQGSSNVAFNGYVEGASDMVGLTDYEDKSPANQTAFTAEHRGAPRPSPARRRKK
jgi:hypothetical protein